MGHSLNLSTKVEGKVKTLIAENIQNNRRTYVHTEGLSAAHLFRVEQNTILLFDFYVIPIEKYLKISYVSMKMKFKHIEDVILTYTANLIKILLISYKEIRLCLQEKEYIKGYGQ